MNRLTQFRSPLLGLYVLNFVANFTGNIIIALLNFFTPLEELRHWTDFITGEGLLLVAVFIPLVVILGVAIQERVQLPISIVLASLREGAEIDAALMERGRRRLLLLPLVLGWINIVTWVGVTALFTPFLMALRHWDVPFGLYVLFRGCMIALIAGIAAFFLVDDYARRHLITLFFPQGRLSATPVRLKISVLRRIRVLFGAGTSAPLLLLVGTIGFAAWQTAGASVPAAQFGKEILLFAVVVWIIFVAFALGLNFLVGKSILQPIRDMLELVRRVHHGDYHGRVPVIANDELGDLADGMNDMTEGLRERERMRRSMSLAKEIQQALLPRDDPRLPGLDIAGSSIYCEETGGDYYDYLVDGRRGDGQVAIVIGDVSGHGIASALLMATGRGFLRQRAALPGSIAAIITDINRQLIHDVAESGSFMTLFFLTVDGVGRRANWVRAGHDPALLYDPERNCFDSLGGRGPALGIDAGAVYREYRREGFLPGQVILLGTDGIWEANSPSGEMFGKARLRRLIRRYAGASARDIMIAILSDLEDFHGGLRPHDDITLVVVKATD